ncbi:hypothetical protein N5D48_07910 [Pseudomonas sp. GD03858]|uniref:DUF6543 domain-containing protein n=1 Tax=unclassified Pseudomonas TaxID=196821 RepID=UPI00244B4168|nr:MULTISPECIES: DUF6543 domain-containing protein [unclassified Pseudomonas]MDH0646608.1 hypothetical protein [Pseudomonas sp. GD03867]MDH0662324.1 hypothetical protein [Pseudomonas sp. GD03858]
MISEALFPDLSFLKKQNAPASNDELLAQLSLLTLALQAQLSTVPRFSKEYEPDTLEQVSLDTARIEQRMPEWQVDMDEWWTAQGKGGPSSSNLRAQLYQLFELELALHAIVEPEFRAVIESLLSAGEQSGDMVGVVVTAGEVRVPLAGSFAVVRDIDEFADDDAFLFYGPAWGVKVHSQRIDAVDSLRQALLQGMAEQAGWIRFLPGELLTAVENGETLALSFEDFAQAFAVRQMADLRTLQGNLLADLEARATESPVEARLFNETARLDAWIGPIQTRLAAHMKTLRLARVPSWRSNLEEEALAAYSQLELQMAQTKARVDEHLGNLRDYRTFAASRMRDWLQRNLKWASVAPERIRVTVRTTGYGAPLYRSCSLLDWVISGGYAPSNELGHRLVAEVDDEGLRERLTHAQMQRMIDGLNLRLEYRRLLVNALNTPATRDRLSDAATTQLALANAQAHHSGELPEPIHARITELLAGNLAVEGLDLHRIKVHGMPLRNIYCMTHGNDFLLYAPGAPGGDLRRFAPLVAVQLALVGMLSNPTGMAFVLSRTRAAQRAKLQSYLSRLESPTWYPGMITLEPLKGSLAQAMARDLILAQYDELQLLVPRWYLNAKPEDRLRIASLDNELASLQPAHQADCTIPTLQAFAREVAAKRINEYPGNSGRWIDPDSVMIESTEGKLTFTQWMAWGYPSSVNFQESSTISSEVGQDLSHLELASLAGAIREASSGMGARYANHMKAVFLDKARPQQERQSWLHRSMMGVKVRRDFLAASLAGHLDTEQSAWLRSISETVADDDILKFHHFERLAFKQGLDRLVEGGYLLNGSPNDHLVYLSDAADGRMVRTLADIAESWRVENLGVYFASRATSADKAAMRQLDHVRLNDPEGVQIVYDAHSHTAQGRITDWDHDLVLRADHRLRDAAHQTTSISDRVLQSMEHVVLPVVGVLTGGIAVLGMPLLLISSTVNLALSSLTFSEGAHAWWEGNRSEAVMKFVSGAMSVGSAVGLGKVIASLYTIWSPGPSGVFSGLLKETLFDWGPKSASPVAETFGDELMAFLDSALSGAPQAARELAPILDLT